MKWTEYRKNEITDQMLRSAVIVDTAPVPRLNQTVLAQIQQQPTVSRSHISSRNPLLRRLRILAPIPLLSVILVLLFTLTAYAAIRLMTARETAETMGYGALAEAFYNEDSLCINETQTSQGYDITLLGFTLGDTILDLFPDISISSDRAYAVIALSNADGTPLPTLCDDPDEEYVPDLYLTFLAKGYGPEDNPLDLRTRDMHYQDGIYYYVVQCQNLSQYAGDGIYLAVNKGIFCSPMDFLYDASTGLISLNNSYDNIHALFEITWTEEILDKIHSMPQTASPYEIPSDQIVIPETVPDIYREPGFSGWTEEQLQLLNSISLPGSPLYVTENRILTFEQLSDSSQSILRIFDYDGVLLHEWTGSSETACTGISFPYCTLYGFVLPFNSGYCVYDYDFNLLYQFDPKDIPAGYPSNNEISDSPDGEHAAYGSYHILSGAFSSNLRCFICNINTQKDGMSLTQWWLYDSVREEWRLLYHGDIPYDGLESLLFYQCVPSSDGQYALFTGTYQNASDDRLPHIPGTGCHGILSLETGEILLLQNGTPDQIDEADNCFFLSLSTLHNREGYYLIIDTADLSATTIQPDTNNESCSTCFSPDGRWILHCVDDPASHIYRCCLYDWRNGTVTETFELQTEDASRAYFSCYAGGYMMCSYRGTFTRFYSYQ